MVSGGKAIVSDHRISRLPACGENADGVQIFQPGQTPLPAPLPYDPDTGLFPSGEPTLHVLEAHKEPTLQVPLRWMMGR